MTERRRPNYRVIQTHHISYEPEIKTDIFQSEHHIITRLRRLWKSVPSNFFRNELGQFLLEHPQGYSQKEMEELKQQNMLKRIKRKLLLRLKREIAVRD